MIPDRALSRTGRNDTGAMSIANCVTPVDKQSRTRCGNCYGNVLT